MSFLLSLALIGSGLYGMVSRGPTAPVCHVGKPCSAPASGSHLVFHRHGVVIARVRVARNGRYSVALRPGIYRVTVKPAQKIGSGISPRRVRVKIGPARELDFQIDTGIR